MTEEEHQDAWPRAQAMIDYAAIKKPDGAGSDYDLREAKRIIRETGYGAEYLSEIANSIGFRAQHPENNPARGLK